MPAYCIVSSPIIVLGPLFTKTDVYYWQHVKVLYFAIPYYIPCNKRELKSTQWYCMTSLKSQGLREEPELEFSEGQRAGLENMPIGNSSHSLSF